MVPIKRINARNNVGPFSSRGAVAPSFAFSLEPLNPRTSTWGFEGGEQTSNGAARGSKRAGGGLGNTSPTVAPDLGLVDAYASRIASKWCVWLPKIFVGVRWTAGCRDIELQTTSLMSNDSRKAYILPSREERIDKLNNNSPSLPSFTPHSPHTLHKSLTMAGGVAMPGAGTIDGGFLRGRALIYPLFLITLLFFLWGFSYGLLDVLNSHFQTVLGITKLESTGLQVMYFGGG